MTTRLIAYLAASATALSGFSAAAATVIPYAGDVFVSQGKGFQKIDGATTVKVGDSVMVSPNGLAQVKLDDGNAITVSPGHVLSVPAKARAKDAALPDGASPTADLAIPAPIAGAGVVTPTNPTSDYTGLIAAGVLVAGAAGGAAALTSSGGPPFLVPASP